MTSYTCMLLLLGVYVTYVSTAVTPPCLTFGSSTGGVIHGHGHGFGKRLAPLVSLGPDCSHNLSTWLWYESEDSRMRSLNSTFVRGVIDGTLHPSSFGQFMIQDAMFCYGSSESFKVASSHLKQNSTLKAFLDYKTNSYKRYGDNILKTWLINNQSAIRVGKECQDYIDSHVRVSRDEDPIYTVIATIPCERMWPWLGITLASMNHHYGVYSEFAHNYFDSTSTGYQKAEAIINEAYAHRRIDIQKALQIYYKSMEGEAHFFNSVLP